MPIEKTIWDNEKPIPRLVEWSVYSDPYKAPYKAPELQSLKITGRVYNHHDPIFKDGDWITTSRVVSSDGRKIKTRSGHTYFLGSVSESYFTYLMKKGYDFDHDNPIKVKL